MEKGKSKLRNRKKMMLYTFLTSVILLCLTFVARLLPYTSLGADTTIRVRADLEKYMNYYLSEEDKGTLVQYQIKTKMEYGGEEFIPVRNTETVVNLGQIDGKYPYDVKVITKSTEVTNGQTTNLEDHSEYDASTGTLVIRANNQNENGEPICQEEPAQDASDTYVVICYYDTYAEGNPERELQAKIEAKSTLFTEENTQISSEEQWNVPVTENYGKLTSIDYETQEIYNGYMKSNLINGTDYVTQYEQTQKITVSKKEAQEKIEVIENNTFVKMYQDEKEETTTRELGNNHNLVYKSTKITKEEIQKLLGEDFVVEILDADENEIATINKDTEFDEDGTLTIIYENEPENIIVRTSEVQKEGILYLKNTKEIKSTMVNFEDTKIRTTAQIRGIKGEETEPVWENAYEIISELKEARNKCRY